MGFATYVHSLPDVQCVRNPLPDVAPVIARSWYLVDYVGPQNDTCLCLLRLVLASETADLAVALTVLTIV